MRDPARIEGILAEVRKRWNQYPDLRFGQLVVNVLGTDPYYVDDGEAYLRFRDYHPWRENASQ